MQGVSQVRELVAGASGARVWVAGKLAVHRRIYGEPLDGCGAELVPTLKLQAQYDVPAGAARLARILNEAGATVTVAGIVGDDLPGAALLARFEDEGIGTSGVVISEAVATEVSTSVASITDPDRCVCEVLRLCEVEDETVRPRLEKLLLDTLEQAADGYDALAVLRSPDRYMIAYTAAAGGLRALDGPPVHEIEPADVERFGSLGPTDPKLVSPAELRWMARQVRDTGGEVAFTNGCFDILHAGHVNYLREASQHGDFFVVALNSDESVRRLKGSGRPVVAENERAAVLSGLGCIDAIVLFSTDDVQPLLEQLKPEVYVKGGDYTIDTINQDERRIVEAYGGRIALIPGQEGASTTSILTRIREQKRR